MVEHAGLTRISEIEEHKGDDEYLSLLYATENSFILSWPAIDRSLTIDKKSLKMTEHELYLEKQDQEEHHASVLAAGVCGLLGILPIYGLNHLVIAASRTKVCELPTYKQPLTGACRAGVYQLTEVQLIPFTDVSELSGDEQALASHVPAGEGAQAKIDQVKSKIKSYLEEGFIFAYNYDLTSNLQRQRELHEQHGFAAKDMIRPAFSWNDNLFTEFRVQQVPDKWFTHLVQGSIDR